MVQLHVENLNERGGDYCHLTGTGVSACDLRAIGHQPALHGKAQRVVAEPGTYKLDWYVSRREPVRGVSECSTRTACIEFYCKDETVEGNITLLHYKQWIRRLIKAGVHHGIAVFAVDFFKQLKESR